MDDTGQAIADLYPSPSEHAIVLSVDEKSKVQASMRTQPGLPVKRGRNDDARLQAGRNHHTIRRHDCGQRQSDQPLPAEAPVLTMALSFKVQVRPAPPLTRACLAPMIHTKKAAGNMCPGGHSTVVSGLGRDYPRRRLSTACGAELAWDRAAMPACCRIWARVRLAASAARSASRIRDSLAARLVNCVDARLTA